MDGFDHKRAKKYAFVTTIKIVILYILLLMLCIYALNRVYDEFQISSFDWNLLLCSLVYLLPFLLFPLVAYIAGGFEPGDKRRLIGRCIMAALLAALLLLKPEDLTYDISDVMIDQTSGLSAKNIELTMSVEGFMILMAPISIFTLIDALLEYLHPITSSRYKEAIDTLILRSAQP